MSIKTLATTIGADVDGPEAPFTVAAALELPSFRGGMPEVVVQGAGVHRPIRWAHIGEVRHLPTQLRGGELVLTTGIALDGDARHQQQFVAGLAQREVAAIVLELGSVFKSAPQPLLVCAGELGVTVIVLHREVPFVEISEAVNQEIVDRRLRKASRLERLHECFTGLMLDGAGVPEILSTLAEEIGNPIVLQSEDRSLLFHAVHREPSERVLSAWEAHARDLAVSVDACVVALPRGQNVQSGALVCLATDQPFDPITVPAMERAAALVAVATRQNRQEEVLVARERGNMLARLMGSELDEADIARQVEVTGFPPRVPYLLPCMIVGPQHHSVGMRAAVFTSVWREVRRELEADSVPVLGGLLPGERAIALVVGLAAPTQREARADRVYAITARAIERQFGVPDAGALHVGDASWSWVDALRSLREVEAAAASPRDSSRGWHDATAPDLQRLLWNLRQTPDLATFVERRLAPLIEHDEQRRAKLLPTLEAYLDFGGRKAETARVLHLERQSLYHRISRIEALLGASLDDADTRLGLHLAVRARKLLAPQQAARR